MATPTSPAKSRAISMMPADIVRLVTARDHWTEAEYLVLDNNIGNWMVELVDGRLDFPPMPDMYHQDIVIFLLFRLDEFVSAYCDGEVLQAPLSVRLGNESFRKPDISYFKAHRIKDKHRPPEGADLVMEIVSPGEEARERDLETKRRDYAQAKIPEYWIVDPETKTITVLALSGKSYKVHGEFKAGQTATSKLLKGFQVTVSDVFAAGDGK
jgi:Uma2 family endonuclease